MLFISLPTFSQTFIEGLKLFFSNLPFICLLFPPGSSGNFPLKKRWWYGWGASPENGGLVAQVTLYPHQMCDNRFDFVDLSFRIVKHLNAVLEFFVALLNCVGLFLSWTPLTYPPYNRKIIHQRCSCRDKPSLDFSTDIKHAHSSQVKRCHCVHFKLTNFFPFFSSVLPVPVSSLSTSSSFFSWRYFRFAVEAGLNRNFTLMAHVKKIPNTEGTNECQHEEWFLLNMWRFFENCVPKQNLVPFKFENVYSTFLKSGTICVHCILRCRRKNWLPRTDMTEGTSCATFTAPLCNPAMKLDALFVNSLPWFSLPPCIYDHWKEWFMAT